MDDWRVRVILGALVLVIVGAFLWPSGDEAPDGGDAEQACRMFVERQVEPLDVDHRDPGDSTVAQDGDTFRVRDRAAVDGDLVNYECTVTVNDGDWRLDDLSLR